MNVDEDRDTATLDAARAHARSQAGEASNAVRDLPDGVRAAAVLWDETIGCGDYASRVVPRGAIVRLHDIAGDACAAVLLYNARNTAERLNVADTVKVQWQAYLGAGALLLSDMGRVLATIVTDTSGRHDALCGCSNRRSAAAKYGDGAVSGRTPNTRDLLVLAGAKCGLLRRDIGPNVNFFKRVTVDDDGALCFDGAAAGPSYVELRAELPIVLLVANSPHPLDPRPEYAGGAVRATAWVPAPDDQRTARTQTDTPERVRAFENTDEELRGALV